MSNLLCPWHHFLKHENKGYPWLMIDSNFAQNSYGAFEDCSKKPEIKDTGDYVDE